jgi:hypothetical protein
MNKLTSKIGLFEISKYVIRMGWIINVFCKIGKSQGKYPIVAENRWCNVQLIMKMGEREKKQGESWTCINFGVFLSFTQVWMFSLVEACNIVE